MNEAREKERAGCIPEAVELFEAAITAAELGEPAVLAEALRRLGAVCDRRNEFDRARALCQRSYRVACDAGIMAMAAEALNVLGTVELHCGHMPQARAIFVQALELGGADRDIRTRVEGNLGIVSNIEGDFAGAWLHYSRALHASREAKDERSCAIAYVNLGITATQLGKLDEADSYFRQCRDIADSNGDLFLSAACSVNHAKVHVERRRFADARSYAEAALAIFDQLGARAEKAEAYRVIGIVYRETGRIALAESRLRTSIDLSRAARSALKEAEASRELAVLYDSMGRNQDALAMLNSAHRLFRATNAQVDLINVDAKLAELEAAYLALGREWGESIETSDRHPFGHCGRVAHGTIQVARAMGFPEREQTPLRLGAYLHDVGKVKVPHEILNKAGALTREDLEVLKRHTVWGVELLRDVDFPWDVKGIIRWHHERVDGTGYPDGLRGEEIPVAAQIVGIVDAYDSLVTDRPYRRSLPRSEAIEHVARLRQSWSNPVFVAFMQSVGKPEFTSHHGVTSS